MIDISGNEYFMVFKVFIKLKDLIWYYGNGINCVIVFFVIFLCIVIFFSVGISYNYFFEVYERIWYRLIGLKKCRAFDFGG